MCNIEFPHFGASYPDAHCINGYLWDMDSYENGCYTIGGDDPCPFCNTEAWLKTVLDNEEFASREEALEWVEKMREKLGAEHRGSSEIPNDLEEAANRFAIFYDQGTCDGIAQDCFIAGAEWQEEQDTREMIMSDGSYFQKCYELGKKDIKEQMMKEAVEGKVMDFSSNQPRPQVDVYVDPNKYCTGDKVRVIVCKKEDKKDR